jgi:hypothetical protein
MEENSYVLPAKERGGQARGRGEINKGLHEHALYPLLLPQ